MRTKNTVAITFEEGSSSALAQMTEITYDSNGDPQYFAALNPKQVRTYNYIVLDLTTAATATIDTISELFGSTDTASVSEVDYLYDTNYKSRNITGLPAESRVRDASGTVRSKSQVVYDETGSYPLLNPGSTTNWDDPGTAYRGNATTTRSWTDVAGDSYLETHAQYDVFGNPRKSWDARGNVTETEYASTYFYAYPTKVSTPVPDPNGTHGANTALTTEMTYDANTGLVLTTTDANGLTTTVEYDDPLLRPTTVTAPNGQETVTEYGAGTSDATRWVKVSSQIDDAKWKEGYSWFDGLGRTVRTQSVDSDGDVFTETEFDQMGRPKRVTNPYRTGDTKLWTESFYDDLGRVWKVTTPDNAEVLTDYGLATSGSQIGTAVTVADQAGKLRRSITNALGQLKRVDEPNASNELGAIDDPNQYTVYGYDVLNNLLTVSQGVQTRTFVYDALSRLKSASNPESGTILYAYDPNGNLTSKTDARSITTTYVYDALNRVTERSYDDNATLPVYYTYDNLSHAMGQLIKVTTGSGSTPFSVSENTEFDAFGRVKKSKQSTDGTVYNEMEYTYNLSGALIEEKYPSGRVVRNTLDNDGDLMQIQSAKASQTLRNYANGFTYTAAGAVSAMRLGNGKWESTVFNSRLQPTRIGLGGSASDQSLMKLDYTYGVVENNQLNTAKNNGNIQSQTITVPTVGTSTGFTVVQTYNYDSLNRIDNATEMVTPAGTNTATQSWRQDYAFDRYGNRNFVEANTTTIPRNCADSATPPNPIICDEDRKVFNPGVNAANNRLSSSDGYLFDAAGNTTRDPQLRKFTYDAENKQVEVKNSSNETIGKYWYDGDGRRVKKLGWINGQWEETIFVYDASSRLVAEYSTNLSQTPQVAYLTNDHLGSPRINTDENGAVISRHDYRPYGEEVTERTHSQYAADTIRKQFTGYERDNETELDFAQARYFNSGFGRFSSPDPYNMIFEKEKGRCKVAKRMIFLRFIVQPQNWNRYIYVVNNPTNLTDPTGLIYLRKDGITYYIPDATYNQNLEKDENFYKDYAVVPYGSIVRVGDGATGIFEPFIGQSVVLLPNGKLRPINDIGDFSVDVNISGEPLEQIEPIWGNRDVGINLLNDPMQDGWRAESRNFPRGDPSGSVDPYNGGYRHCVSACLLFKRGGLIGHLGRKIWDWRNETSETAESRGDMRAEDIGEHLAKYSCGLCTCESECLQAFPAP